MVKDKIKTILKEALNKCGLESRVVPLAHPTNPTHGDFATSVALQLAKKLQKKPIDIAHEIVKHIPAGDLVIDRVEVVNPGFINIFLHPSLLLLEMFIYTKHSLLSDKQNHQTILMEYGQPNTHKIPHLGHLYSYIYGESLARILEKNGNKVIRTNYQGDVGPHVAKCLWQYMKVKNVDKPVRTLKDNVLFLQKCYQEGSHAYESGEQAKTEIDVLNNKIYTKDKEILEVWEETRQWSIEYYQEFEKQLGIVFARHYFESETSQVGRELVEKHIGSVFEKSKGAVVFKGEQYGLHTRVFLNSQNNPTYEAKDVGLISIKKKEYPFDLSFVTTANEQNTYWEVIAKVSELLFPDLAGKVKHLGFGMINLTSGKMSSRTGQIIDAFSLIDIVTGATKKAFDIKDESLAQSIALASIKYSFLKSDPLKNIIFDIEKSIAKDGDSGPYLLYTYVRTQSILKQTDYTFTDVEEGTEKGLNDEELKLLRTFYKFEEVVEEAAQTYSPSLLATYLFDLAQAYNLFYQKHQVLKAESNKRGLRLALTKATGEIVKAGLNLLGIATVEKM